MSIVDAFFRRVDMHPERVALLRSAGAVTYSELADHAEAVAARLTAAGVEHGDIVGLYLPRGEDVIAAMLGALHIGAAYLPLDTTYPTKLLRYICEDSAPRAMLVDDDGADSPAPFWTCPTLSAARHAPSSAPKAAVAAVRSDEPAYVMYTSGSTGRPKGVLIPQRGVLRLVIGSDYATLGEDEVILQLAPLSFDASTFEIWGALLNGGRLAIMEEARPSLDEIASAISRYGVSTLWLTAGLFHLMVDHRLDGLRPLRQLLAGGDVLSPSHVARALAELPDCRLINGYGPTENTTFTCCHQITIADCHPGPVPIGRPIAGTRVAILDETLRPVPAGDEGELFIGGEGLALGYLKRPDLTADRFVADPFADRPGERLYRSGDRVRRRPDGLLEFLGRVDRQIKVNGKRVELDEVEAWLRRAPEVADAAAVAVSGPDGQRQVAAYVVPAGHAGRPGFADDLTRFLRTELPDYMVPATFTLLEALPLSDANKVDRSNLPPPKRTGRRPAAGSGSPCDETTAALVAIWRRVLNRPDVGLDDNFFDLGGTSLQLTQAHALITASIDRELTILDMFSFPRISMLSARIARRHVPARAGLGAGDRARMQRAALDQAARRAASKQ
jgi:amino acid adenylation domain-containing protein